MKNHGWWFVRTALAVGLFTLVSASAAHAQTVFSGVGGVCLNVEGGVRLGARVIGWPCQGGANEKFVADGAWIKLAGTNYCLTSNGRNEGSELSLQQCRNDNSTQNFAFSGTSIKHNTGYCVDLKGAGWWNLNDGQNKPAILWSCHGGRNQQWFRGGSPQRSIATSSLRSGATVVVSGQPKTYTWNGSSLIGNDGASLITNDGGSIVAAGAGNIVAAGAGN